MKVFLYGFGKLCRLEDVKWLREYDCTSTLAMDRLAEYMLDNGIGTQYIYAVVDRPGLLQEYLYTVKRPHFAKYIEFEDLTRREAVRVWKR